MPGVHGRAERPPPGLLLEAVVLLPGPRPHEAVPHVVEALGAGASTIDLCDHPSGDKETGGREGANGLGPPDVHFCSLLEVCVDRGKCSLQTSSNSSGSMW